MEEVLTQVCLKCGGEISELLKIEFEKTSWGSHKPMNKNESRRTRKMLSMQGNPLYGAHRKLMPWISTSFKSMIVDTMKVLFVNHMIKQDLETVNYRRV